MCLLIYNDHYKPAVPFLLQVYIFGPCCLCIDRPKYILTFEPLSLIWICKYQILKAGGNNQMSDVLVFKHQFKIRMQTWEFLTGPSTNYGIPYSYERQGQWVSCRFSFFLFFTSREKIQKKLTFVNFSVFFLQGLIFRQSINRIL